MSGVVKAGKERREHLLCIYLSGTVARSCYNMHEMDGLGKGACYSWDGMEGWVCGPGGGEGWNEGGWM